MHPKAEVSTSPASSSLAARFLRLRWFPLLAAVILLFILTGQEGTLFGPRLLLPVLNVLFITCLGILVAYRVARSYVRGESTAVLLLGCGMLAFGTGAAFASAAAYTRASADIQVTLYGTGAWLAAAFWLTSSLLAAEPEHNAQPAPRGRTVAAWAYGTVLVFIGLLAVVKLAGLFPLFLAPGGAPTTLRQVVLGSAIAMLVVSAFLVPVFGRHTRPSFITWSAPGLLLIAFGLTALLTQHVPDTAVGWLGQCTQYLGFIYLYAAALSVPARPSGRIPLEQVLRETHDHYRRLVELCPDPILVHSEGRYVFANPAAARLFGAASPEDLVGKSVLELVHADDRATVAERIDKARRGEVIPLRLLRIMRFDGSSTPVEVIGSLVEYRCRPAFQIVVRDMTERSRIEDALAASQSELRHRQTVLEAINQILTQALSSVSEEELGRFCLKVAEDVTGSQLGFLGQVCDGKLDDIAVSDRSWTAYGKEREKPPTGFPIHGLYGRPLTDGKPFFTNDPGSHPDRIGVPEGHPVLTAFLGVPLVQSGRTIGLIGLGNRPGGYGNEQVVDVEELAPAIVQALMRTRAEHTSRAALAEAADARRALRESEDIYRAVGETIDYGVWVCAPDGRNIYASESFLRLVGMTQEQCSNFGWGDVLHPEDSERTIQAWKDCVRTEGTWDIEHRFRGVDGAWHPILARGVPVKNERGDVICWAGINLDISRMKQAEDALRDADRRKNEFLATLSHELRNPLAPIRYALELMGRKDVAWDPKPVVERQLAHLVRLVDDLLDVSRIASNKVRLRRERVTLGGIVQHALESVGPEVEQAKHSLTVTLPPEQVWLDADPHRLGQVLVNLLNNAVRYTPPGGILSLAVEPEGEHHVVISVTDNGVGLRPDDLGRVFDMFTQLGETERGGLGIGLALVKGIVELHGGTVEARSTGPGAGSEFRVRLPRAAAPEIAESGLRLISRSGSRCRVLIVDDNIDAADMMRALLELQGHDVVTAYDGASALEALSRFEADVGLFDIGLPVMDGYQLARRVREDPRFRRMYLVAITGWGQESDRQRAKDSGFDAHLTKPADPDEVARLIEASRSPSRQPASL